MWKGSLRHQPGKKNQTPSGLLMVCVWMWVWVRGCVCERERGGGLGDSVAKGLGGCDCT